jgi:hypothetical protein
MAQKVRFEALNVEPCTGLHGLVQAHETRHLYGFRLQPDLIDLFRRLIYTEDVEHQRKMKHANMVPLHPNSLAEFGSHAAQFLEPLSDPLHDLLIRCSFAGGQEEIPAG